MTEAQTPQLIAGDKGMPAGRAIGVIVVALVIGLILNAPDIRRTADRQEAGWRRDLAVAMIEPFEWFSKTMRLDAPHNLIDAAIGRPADQDRVAQNQNETTTTTITPATAVSTPETTTTAALARR